MKNKFNSFIELEVKFVLLLLVVLLLIGCMGYYDHRVENIGNQMLYGVEMQCGEQEFSYGYLSPGVHAGYSGSLRIAKNDKVIFSWGLDEVNRLSKEVIIDESTLFNEVVFKLDGSNVSVEYE